MDNEGWKPAETAPKDGTRILVYGTWKEGATGRADDERSLGIVSWTDNEDRYHDGPGWLAGEGYYDIYWEFKIWKPLPCVPSDEAIAQ